MCGVDFHRYTAVSDVPITYKLAVNNRWNMKKKYRMLLYVLIGFAEYKTRFYVPKLSGT
jgi:hypothetical protein